MPTKTIRTCVTALDGSVTETVETIEISEAQANAEQLAENIRRILTQIPQEEALLDSGIAAVDSDLAGIDTATNVQIRDRVKRMLQRERQDYALAKRILVGLSWLAQEETREYSETPRPGGF